jgi:polynucleotide 5'-kinase involved in rRNA processing
MNTLQALEEAVKEKHKPVTIFMLGGVDVGKTFTVTLLANRFFEQGLTVAVVDADVGQSDIGPPCCIGMGLLEKRIEKLSDVPFHSLYFAGNTSPYRCTRECVLGAVAAVKSAKALGADIILVDSTGWIEGEDARWFKLYEIQKIHPSLVLAVEQENELEHILSHLTTEYITLQRSINVRSRTREERKALREEAYTSYFRAAKNRIFERSLLTRNPEDGVIVGLCSSKRTTDEREILGLGIMRGRRPDTVVIFTPVDDAGAAIQWIAPGSVKLTKLKGGFKEIA